MEKEKEKKYGLTVNIILGMPDVKDFIKGRIKKEKSFDKDKQHAL